MKKIKIAKIGCPHDYESGLLIATIKSMNYQILWTNPSNADLVIFGSFFQPNKAYRWIPKRFRSNMISIEESISSIFLTRKLPPITIFHTAENLRHNRIPADYSISFDLGINSTHHFRLPYWMEMLDWSHEGVFGNQNPRYGGLLNIKKLTQPLGNSFLNRNGEAVFFSSHLREPRLTLIKALEKNLYIKKYGAIFDKSIKNHHASNFAKIDILQNYTYNLCPENSLYPGYVTEKIPEAFHSGCLPITWVDVNVKCDFNPNAFINLAPAMMDNFEPFANDLRDASNYSSIKDEPLITSEPSLEKFIIFLKR